MKRWLFVILLLWLAACAEAAPATPFPTPLPTAVPPAPGTNAGGAWGISFSYRFPEAFWPAGVHRYAFNLSCPEDMPQLQFAGNWNQFSVSEDHGLSTEPIYLRLNGLALDPFTPNYLPDPGLHPNQDTTAIVHFLGLSLETAQRAGRECEAFIAWDQVPPQLLTPLEPFQP